MTSKGFLDSLLASFSEFGQAVRVQWSGLAFPKPRTFEQPRIDGQAPTQAFNSGTDAPVTAPETTAPVAPAKPVRPPAGSLTANRGAEALVTADATEAGVDPTFVMMTRRTHLVCPGEMVVDQDSFMVAVREEAEALQLPFRFMAKTVKWSVVNLIDKQIVVEATNQSKIVMLLNLDYLGRIAFITQRTYLLPFLPPPIQVSSLLLILGVLAFLGGLLMAFVGIVGFDFQYVGMGTLAFFVGIVLMIAHILRVPAARARAEAEWLHSVQQMFVRAQITDEMAALGTALEEAVQAAVDKVFIQHGARIEAAEREKKSQSELNDELKQQYKRFLGG